MPNPNPIPKWKKGQSGNPKGRQHVPELLRVKSMARLYTDEALAVLRSIMKSKKAPSSARVAAANAILDRGWGRPEQALHHSGTVSLSDFLNALD